MVLPGALPRRERARAATIDEIKNVALDLMRKQGTTDVRFTDIARAMGMTPPALYRYFADRDALLTALVYDAYDRLDTAVVTAQEAVPDDDLFGRWRAGAEAYRTWARQEPQQFALIFGLPVPGFCLPDCHRPVGTVSRLFELFVRAQATGQISSPHTGDVAPAVVACARDKNEEMGIDLRPETFQAMLSAWASLHGLTCLETYGHLEWMPAGARDALFDAHLRVAAEAAGLSTPG